MTPAVSVVMTAYGDLRFVDEAVSSILRQDFTDFELIIVDDGCHQPEILQRQAARDGRIRLLVNERNLGTAVAANRGIAAARGDIIARLDADDLAEPTRLGCVAGAFAADPGLGLVGSDVLMIDEAGQVIGSDRPPRSDLAVRWTILFHNPFYHSAAAFRRSCFDAAGGYRPEELVSQDHYLWFDMLPHCRAKNLPAFLARYRINPLGLSATNATRPRNRTHKLREALWRDIGLDYDLYDDVVARRLTDFLRGNTIAAAHRAESYVRLLAALRRFLAAGAPRAEAAALTGDLLARMAAAPPPDLRGRVKFTWSAARLGWLSAMRSMAGTRRRAG